MRIVKWVVRAALAVGALLVFAFFALFTPVGRAVMSGEWLFGDAVDPGCDGEPNGPAAVVVFDLDTGAERWSRTVGHSSTVIAHDDVLLVGGYDGVTRGLDRVDGAIVWCMEAENLGEASGGLAFAGETVGVIGDAGTLIGLDPATGDELWRTSIDQPSPEPAVGSTIAFNGGEFDLTGTAGLFYITDRAAEAPQVLAFNPDDGAMVERPPRPWWTSASGDDNNEIRGGIRLRATSKYVENRQERIVKVADATTLDELWSKTVPGYRSELAVDAAGTPSVLVIDQTGGKGDIDFATETMLTAYDGLTGNQIWQRPIPRETRDVYATAGGLLVVPHVTEILGIDVATGDELWSVDHGSPGKARPYSVVGNYLDVIDAGDGAAAGLLVAEKPYRD